jgi:DNA-binding CsgD family transcriptional regulator
MELIASVQPGLSSAALIRVLDEIDYGLIVVSADGSVRYANLIARAALVRGRPFVVRRGRLSACNGDEQAVLATALADARHGRRQLIMLGNAPDELSVAAIPVGSVDLDPSGEPSCLLLLGKQQACETLTIDFYSRSHGLTGAEADVLRGLCLGRTPKEIAQERGVAISTVRTHIDSVRGKTRTESIGDLTRRMAVLPPITHAMKGSLAA